MKKLFLTLLAAVGMTSVSAQQYEINGTAPRGVLKVYLRNFETSQVDSSFVADGKFSFKGNAEGKIEQDFYGNRLAPLRPLNNKVVVPEQEEQELNPRSRSAKLRIAEKPLPKQK